MAPKKKVPNGFYILDEEGNAYQSFRTLEAALSADDEVEDGFEIVQVVRRFKEPERKGRWEEVS